MRDKNSNCGDSILAKFNNYRSYGTYLSHVTQDAVVAQGSQRNKAFEMLCQLEASVARAAATATPDTRLLPLFMERTLRMRDSDRLLVYNEFQRLQLMTERCVVNNSVKDAVTPLRALEIQATAATAVWIHDRLRDGMLWRALLREHGSVAISFCRYVAVFLLQPKHP